MLNILLRKMYALRCILAKCICNILFCKNAFLHQQNVRIFVFCKAKNTAFLHQMHFCTAEHFPLEKNVHFCKMYASNAFLQTKMLESGKMHFGIKCIFASNIFLQSIKCIFASNAFLHQMHFCKPKC